MDGGWAWALLFMIQMMLVMWAVIALVALPWMRTDRRWHRLPVEQLDDRLAAGEISVEEYRLRRAELDRRSAA